MNKDENAEPKTKSFFTHRVAPIATALVVGGTAPWWVELIKGGEVDNTERNFSSEDISRASITTSDAADTDSSVEIQDSDVIESENSTIANDDSTVSGDNSTIASDQAVLQESHGSGPNISAGRDVQYNEAPESPDIPSYKGEIGPSEAGKGFTTFIFENQGEIVLIDIYSSHDDFKNVSVSNNNFGIDDFHLTNNCPPSLTWDCLGTVFRLDRGDISKDADFTYIRGILKIEGYFAVKGCFGPHQGYFGCTLRPLNPEDIL